MLTGPRTHQRRAFSPVTHLRLIIVKKNKNPAANPCSTAPSAVLSPVEMQDGKQRQLRTWERWRAGLSNHNRMEVGAGARPDGGFQHFRSCLAERTQKGPCERTYAEISVLQRKYTRPHQLSPEECHLTSCI